MKIVIDTSSLLSLVRYYLPFDTQSILFSFVKKKLEDGEIMIVDKILEECAYLSKGLVLSSLQYLTEKPFLKASKLPINTDGMIAPSPAKF